MEHGQDKPNGTRWRWIPGCVGIALLLLATIALVIVIAPPVEIRHDADSTGRLIGFAVIGGLLFLGISLIWLAAGPKGRQP